MRNIFGKKALCFFIGILFFSLTGTAFGDTIEDVTSTELKRIVKQKNEKVVVLAFWATWCEVCRKHIPELNEISDKYENKNVSVIGVSLDDEQEKVRDFIETNGITFPVFRAEDTEEISYIYQIKKIPVLYYYVDGKKHHTEAGYTPPDHLVEDLESCLAGKKAPSKQEELEHEHEHENE